MLITEGQCENQLSESEGYLYMAIYTMDDGGWGVLILILLQSVLGNILKRTLASHLE
jgi:hypothetical protein